jgi:hypothetical protein
MLFPPILLVLAFEKDKPCKKFAMLCLFVYTSPINEAVASGNGNEEFYRETTCLNFKYCNPLSPQSQTEVRLLSPFSPPFKVTQKSKYIPNILSSIPRTSIPYRYRTYIIWTSTSVHRTFVPASCKRPYFTYISTSYCHPYVLIRRHTRPTPSVLVRRTYVTWTMT